MGTILKKSRKILYRSRSHPSGIYIQALFSDLDLASRTRLSEPAAEDPVPGRSTHRKLATPCTRQPEGLFGGQRQLSRISCQLSSPSGGKRGIINSFARRPFSASILMNLLAVADHEQVRNLPMPGKWPQRRACVPDWSRKRDRPVVSARPDDRDRARCRGALKRYQVGSLKILCAALAILGRPGGRPRTKLND
jgi:hypothetical protein